MMQWPEVSTGLRTAASTGSSPAAITSNPGISSSTSGLDANLLAAQASNLYSLAGKSMPGLALGGLSGAPGLSAALQMYQQQAFSGHPQLWTREEVQQWLKRCMEEYSLTDIQTEKFPMNGKALVLLKKEDFVERAPYAGDVLYNILQKLLDTHSKTPVSSGTNSFTPGGASMAEQSAFMSLLLQSNAFMAASLMPGFHGLPFSGLPPRSSLSLTPPISSNQSDCASPDQRLHSSPPQVQPHSPCTLDTERLPQSISAQNYSRPEDVANYHSQSSLYGQAAHPPKSVIKSNHHTICSPMSNQLLSVQKDHEPVSMELSAPARNGKNDCRLLWEFISKLLKDATYTDYIRWENPDDYTFRIVNPSQLSRLWGIQKNRTNMTYEKLSRALRYYYKMDIIEKVPGRRLTYRFMRPPHEIKRGQRGARPGVPRKSRSTDDEAEEVYDAEGDMESDPHSDDDSMNMTSIGSQSYPNYSSLPLDSQPLDLANHDRVQNSARPQPFVPTVVAKARSQSPPSVKSGQTDNGLDFLKQETREWKAPKSELVNGH